TTVSDHHKRGAISLFFAETKASRPRPAIHQKGNARMGHVTACQSMRSTRFGAHTSPFVVNIAEGSSRTTPGRLTKVTASKVVRCAFIQRSKAGLLPRCTVPSGPMVVPESGAKLYTRTCNNSNKMALRKGSSSNEQSRSCPRGKSFRKGSGRGPARVCWTALFGRGGAILAARTEIITVCASGGGGSCSGSADIRKP